MPFKPAFLRHRHALLRWMVFPLLLLCSALASAQQVIKVGVYNYSPMVFVDEQKQAKGLFVDVLDLVAEQEGWKLDYRPGTWSENMERLESGEIDLLVNIAITEERSKKFDFTRQHLFLDWGMVYRRKGSKIDTIFDLRGKRVAILKSSFYAGELKKLLDQFAIDAELVGKSTFADVFKAIEDGEVDAGSNANLAGLQLPESSTIEQTAIAYAPTKLRFAVKKGNNKALLEDLDRRLSALYADQTSGYYKLREKWLGQGNQRYATPAWVYQVLAGMIAGLGLLFAIAMFFKRQVREKTASLSESEQNIAITLNSIGDAVIATDTAGCVTRMNPSAERLTGWALPDARERPLAQVFRIINSDTREPVADPAQLVMAHGKVVGLANHTVLLARDGREYQIADSAAPIVNPDGKIVGVVLVFSDVTETYRAEKDLRDSEARNRAITQSAHDAIVTSDSAGNIVSWNPGAETIFGYAESEVIGQSLTLLMPERYRDGHLAGIDRIGSGQVSRVIGKSVELHGLRKGGSEFPLELSLAKWETGESWFVTGIIRNITERKRAEDRLRQQAALLDLAHSAIIVRGLNDSIAYWSVGAERLYGWSADEATGSVTRELLQTQFPRAMVDIEKKLLEQGFWQGELVHICKDGSRVVVDSRWAVQRDAQKNLLNVLEVNNDITEHKRAEEALRESEEQFRSLTEMSSDFFWETDAEHRLTRRVASAERVSPVTVFRENKQFGLRRWEIPYLSPDQAGWQAHRAVLDGHLSFRNFELSRLAADGTPSYISVSGDPVFDAAGHFRGYRGVGTNITERKRAEKEKAVLEAQFQQAQKMDSVGRLAGGVAHDFNNMLTVILGNVQLAIEQTDPAHPVHTDLVEIRKAANRSADLTRQLLAFARKQVVAPKVLDLNETVVGIIKMLQRLIGEDISLKWLPEANLWPVKIDPSQLDQILANLCINARDAIAGVGNIAIETGNSTFDDDYCAVHAGFAPGDYVRISVSDNGHGIDEEALAHIFEPFFTTKGVGEGTGLGLATVYGAVKQNNGFINVYSEPGTGTTFTIYLPRHEGGAKEEQAAEVAVPLVRGQETILLVEDESSILKLTTRILIRQGYAVLPAKSPVEAVRLASEHTGTIHLLMTDVVMPEMNGRDLAKDLQSRYPSLKVLFMSGYTANIIVHQGVLDKGVHFIQKPFSIDEIAAKTREVLDSE